MSERRPRLGVAVMLQDRAGRLLLGRRGKEPNYGKWVLPGGGVNFGEKWEAAAEREMKEETGLGVCLLPWHRMSIAESIEPAEHRVIIVAEAYVTGAGDLKAGSDLLEVRWFDKEELQAVRSEISPLVLTPLRHHGWL